MNDHEVAAALAGEAADRLVELQQDAIRTRTVGWSLEYEGDEVAHDLIVSRLEHERPHDAVLSEEGQDTRSRLDASRAWIVDPLDGSADFGVGSSEWAVHVALTVDGSPHAGAVAAPGLGEVFSTDPGGALPDAADRDPIVVTGRSRAWIDGRAVAGALDGQLASCGSSGFKAMLVVSGHVDVYVHGSSLMEWDVCAPAAVAEAHGFVVTDATGAPLVYNRARPVVSGIVVCRPELHDRVLAALRHR